MRTVEELIFDRLKLPRVFIHGDFHANNIVFFASDPCRIRAIIDWQVQTSALQLILCKRGKYSVRAPSAAS